jgi:hypothetical protein
MPRTLAIMSRGGRLPNIAWRGMRPWNSTAANCRESSHALERIAGKADQFAEKALDTAEQLATLVGLTQLVLVSGMLRTQAWLQPRLVKTWLAFA